MKHDADTRDIITIGASAGGVDALRCIAAELPADLPAAVFVVLHIGAASHLGAILDAAGPLRAAEAVDGEPIVHGRIYVAPPGRHLLLHDSHLMLRRGPHENLARPAIDPLFRSAACSFASRVVGVVLTGALSDGTAGLRAIKRCGGCAIVQDPRDALVPDMPRNALRHAAIDYCLPLGEIPPLLARLARQPAGPAPQIPDDISLETLVAAQEDEPMDANDQLGEPAPFTCPQCKGPLWQIADGPLLRYRCRVGHAFDAQSMLHAQDGEIGTMLWNLLQSHQQRARLTRRLAEKESANGLLHAALLRRAEDYERDEGLMRKFIARWERQGESSMRADETEEGGIF